MECLYVIHSSPAKVCLSEGSAKYTNAFQKMQKIPRILVLTIMSKMLMINDRNSGKEKVKENG